MLSFLALGFLIGLRHAFEPDHLAAVVTISSRGGGLRDYARTGALWGAGHALTLLLLAGGSLALGLALSDGLARVLEGAVGVMLVGLGVAAFVRLRRAGVHLHAHRHDDGTEHVHLHAHPASRTQYGHAHEHEHRRPSWRTLLVGGVHGLAGSSALVLLAGGAAATPALGVAYVALFGVGAAVGMTALAATIALPFGATMRGRAGLYRALCAAAGLVSIAIGVQLVWTSASPAAA